MLRSKLISAILLGTFTVALAEYVPGEPGGPWTQEELLVVKAKIWALLSNEWSSINYNNAFYSYKDVVSKSENAANFDPLPRDEWPTPSAHDDFGHFAAKLVRLAFHDCLKYEDGSGGCDGCVSYGGMGFRYYSKTQDKYQHIYDDVNRTNNNGLAFTIAILEEIYTNPDYPHNTGLPGPKTADTPSLPESLKASGKSRADLWAFAAKVAIEFTTEMNNYMCDGKPTNWDGSTVGKTEQCQRYLGLDICKTEFADEIEFRYGRKDCTTLNLLSYKADKREVHPNPNSDGVSTQNFFQQNFNFSPRETVAIMGAHTLGRFYYRHSAFKYTWTSREGDLFNNRYYKNLAADGTSEYFMEGYDNNECLLIGDADGNIGDVKWVPSYNGFTKGGGPIHWIKHHFACPQCKHYPPNPDQQREFDRCCRDIPEGKSCTPDNKPRVFDNTSVLIDNFDTKGCERYRFAFKVDEMACNAEMGLFYKFQVTNDGIPTGCPGFEHFSNDVWSKAKYPGQFKQGNVPRRAYNPQCELQSTGDTANIIKQYANDEFTWLSDFTKAFQKMQSNGYSVDGDLTLAPSSESICKISGGRMTCTPA